MLRSYSDPAFADATGTATAAISLGAEAARRHYISGIHVSSNVTAVGVVRIQQGTTDVAVFNYHNQRDINIEPPMRFPPNTAAKVVVDPGVSGQVARLSVESVTV